MDSLPNPKKIANISSLNISDEILQEFFEKSREHLRKISQQNKSVPALTNGSEPPENCMEYCSDPHMRHIFEEYRLYHGYITLAICTFGTIANILNIIILTRKEMSKTPINAILKWLAVCDMFCMLEYIPFTTHMYIIMKGAPDLNYGWTVYMLFHMHFSQILHTVSISLTVTLAVWRYIAIKHPHSRICENQKQTIFFSFVLSPVLCFPTYFVFEIKQVTQDNLILYHLDANEDSELYKINFWVHSVLIKIIPCFILTVISFVLIEVLCRANKRRIKLKGYSAPAGSDTGHRSSRIDRRTDRTTLLLVAVLLLFLITEFPQGILGLLSGIMGKCFLKRCYSMFGEAMDLLALINAAIGFLLYGSMSKQFRQTFKSLFRRENFKHSKIEMTRVTNTNNTNV